MLKRFFDIIVSLTIGILLLPVIIAIIIFIKTDSEGPAIFKQRRIGKNGKAFTLYKFRTMRLHAEKQKKKLLYLNQADGPVFKIRNDPRFTSFGKFLAYTGLDELPQLFNIIKGDMTFVGPRPLPGDEECSLLPWQRKREIILPGLTSLWVVSGAHRVNFDTWMKMDLDYIQNRNLLLDLYILKRTAFIVIRNALKILLRRNNL